MKMFESSFYLAMGFCLFWFCAGCFSRGVKSGREDILQHLRQYGKYVADDKTEYVLDHYVAHAPRFPHDREKFKPGS